MRIRYDVCGLEYDKNYCITDYGRNFGSFDIEDEAQECFDTAIREAYDDLDMFFREDEPEVAYWKIQLEKCVDYDGDIQADMIAEENIERDTED